jgi:formate dehydrogenase alpha subunit
MKITINGNTISTDEGKTVLEVCKEAGIYIPTLCHDERLEPYGGCRLCVIEVKGVPRPITACTTPASEGMEVTTENEALKSLRQSVLSLILSDHPNDCMTCEKAGDCDLQELAYFYEVKPDSIPGTRRNLPIRDDNPLVYFDPNKCILCGRCVRICHEVVTKGTIDLVGRGFTTIPDTAFSVPKNPDNCVFCGQCISTCPVGALVERPSMGKGRTHGVKKVKTTCTYCGTGCNFYLNVKGGKVIRVTSDYSAPVNGRNLCIKGRFGYEFIHHKDRITTPLIREGNDFRPASWDEALTLIARRFTELKASYGPQSIGGFSSSRCTNEENYLMSKWVRTALGSNNVDNCARV